MAGRSSANDSSTDSSGDDEDSESSSSSSSIGCGTGRKLYDDQEAHLSQFREKWRAEIEEKFTYPAGGNTERRHDQSNRFDDGTECMGNPQEVEAKRLFRLGTREEANGNLYVAIEYYRRAYQLLPDVELRIAQQQSRRRRNSHRKRLDSGSSVDSNGSASQESRGAEGRLPPTEGLCHVIEGDETEDGDSNSHKDIDNSNNNNNIDDDNDITSEWHGWCQPETPLDDDKKRHISDLPIEIMIYIFKWIVGSHLDVRALTQLSLVCRCFCHLSRDEELWRLICLRTWGANCGIRPGDLDFSSWRAMAIYRPHVLLNGCYMGRVSYVRNGEPTMGAVCGPCYIVEYYRSIRFYPDGVFYMMTSPEEPAAHVRLLGTRPPSRLAHGILEGHYRLNGDVVTGVLQWRKPPQPAVTSWRSRRRQQIVQQTDPIQQSFQVQLLLKSSRKKNHNVLEWQSYSFVQKSKAGDEGICEFNVKSNAYPALYFSRVRSYMSEVAEEPLQ